MRTPREEIKSVLTLLGCVFGLAMLFPFAVLLCLINPDEVTYSES